MSSGLDLLPDPCRGTPLRVAFPTRSAKYWLNVYGFWHDPAEDERLSAFVPGADRTIFTATAAFDAVVRSA